MVPVIGEEEGGFMKKKLEYTEGPIDRADPKKLVRVPNFLPPPEEIARRMDKIKITITLTADSIDFFKKQAEKHDIQYQRLIRSILDEYVVHHMRIEKLEEKSKKSG